MLRSDERTEGRGISLTVGQWRELERRGDFYDLPLSWLVRRAVERYLDSDEKLVIGEVESDERT